MIRSNSRAAVGRIRAYVADDALAFAEQCCDVHFANAPLHGLICNYMDVLTDRGGRPTREGALRTLLREGSLGETYFDSARDRIAEWLEETDEERDRYGDGKVMETFRNLYEREFWKLYGEEPIHSVPHMTMRDLGSREKTVLHRHPTAESWREGGHRLFKFTAAVDGEARSFVWDDSTRKVVG